MAFVSHNLSFLKILLQNFSLLQPTDPTVLWAVPAQGLPRTWSFLPSGLHDPPSKLAKFHIAPSLALFYCRNYALWINWGWGVYANTGNTSTARI